MIVVVDNIFCLYLCYLFWCSILVKFFSSFMVLL